MPRKAVLLFLFSFFFLFPCVAAGQTWRVDEIVIEGDRRVRQSTIRTVLSAEPGVVSAEEVDRDLRAIFRLGRFRDVAADIETRNGSTVLVYRVTERPLVRRAEFVGNKELKEEKLRPLITFRIPELLSPKGIEASARAIREAYVADGYYAATVEPEIEIREENEAVVTFHIEEGEKVRIRDISIEGNEIFTDKQLKKVMQTKEKWFLSWMTGRGTYQEPVLQNDLEIIADQYFNEGYLQVKVRQPEITLSEDRKSMDIRIEIEEGPQFRIGKLDIQGDLIRDREDLLDLVKFREGDVFSRKLLRESVLSINNLYADLGYAYVNVSPLTRVETEERLVNLLFDIEQGIQVVFDRINIVGNTKTRDKVIRREMKIVEGDLYSATGLKESRRRINNLGFFEEVNVTTAKGPDEAHMNVNVEVKERPTGTFSVGLGYSSVDGVIAQGAISQENFLGRALRLNLAGSLGGRSTTYQLGITNPWFLDRNLTLGFDVFRIEREWTDFDKRSAGGDIKLGFPVTENTRALFLYRYEDKEIFNVDDNASRFIKEQEGPSTLSSITGTFRRDTTDFRLDPSRGSASSLSLEYAGLGGTEKFVKYDIDHRHFFPWKWGTVFSAHGHLGYIQGLGGEEIPIDEKYFLGGLHTLRGFETRQVGPRIRRVQSDFDTNSEDEEFEYVGGEKTAYFNFEYTFPLLKEMGLKGLVFFDAGNAWGEEEDFFSDMRYSAGGGIRWFSPLGPLRLEWGYNLDPREDEPRSNFDFSIGSFF